MTITTNITVPMPKAIVPNNDLKKKGQSVAVCKTDITKRKQTDLMVERCIKLFGNVNILIMSG
ncbi:MULTISPECIES: hypothetical protein [Dehalobacter]|jgi:NADP-dependent 3-hydroxy acid dehydrogenase YdfG|uniref:Uncharacterized protein n=1 Tax=Dehalobacter restrictus (strain DSM 9455 / PER-K23) TaxID=871738 RepID=A0ABN4BVG2_DEHRP|nr:MULTISPECIES: hypothetical protein [Dehalobacter]AHF11204.1 hypothetical protein DEHRE_01385 [Dehalobacter restrictus DSM 9455]